MIKRVFTIPPGAPFLPTFAKALLEGRIAEGYSKRLSPLEIAQATIYVPTQRAASALAQELARAMGRGSMLLPRILPLGALEEIETSLLFEDSGLGAEWAPGAPMAAREIERRMELAALILAWASALQHAIVKVNAHGYECDPGEPLLVAANPASAWHLAGELGNLIDELIIEGVAWEELDPLALPEFDEYWRVTLEFLNIAIKQWPEVLKERKLVDKVSRQAALIEAQTKRLRNGLIEGPVIAAGSTGTNRATARLLAAIAAAPNGAVILPGLDLDLDARGWTMLADGLKGGAQASFTHPQAMLCRLLSILQMTREEVMSLGEAASDLVLRGTFVSQALRPAEATGDWLAYRESIDKKALEAALSDITLIEAADEHEEALAIAIAVREAIETRPGTVALITPSRTLARRVRAELLRWEIDAEDSAGEPLAQRPAGALARLIIACAASKMAAPGLAALLAHPLARLDLTRAELRKRAALLEIALLRSSLARGPLAERITKDLSGLIAAAREEANGRFAHPAKSQIAPSEWARIEDLLRRLGAALAPLSDLQGEHTLQSWAAAHRESLILIAGREADPLGGRDRDALDELFEELLQSAPEGMIFDAHAYEVLFSEIAGEIVLPAAEQASAQVQILGLLEARLLDAALVVLGGLDETVWPPQARTDAFLNRPMRAALGLTPPERKLGQTAHDFAQALGRRKVILTRARKRDGSPTVASRFLQRMAALGGEVWESCRARGEFYVRLAQELDRPPPSGPGKRPLPRPPVSLRPARLSVTEIETLRRDPYAIYASKILRLKELDPVGGPLGFGDFGSAIHRALERFVSEHAPKSLPEDAFGILSSLLRQELARQLEDPCFAALSWPRVEKIAAFYLGFDSARRGTIKEIKAECSGKIDVPLADGSRFTLTARADRIEIYDSARVIVVDYKTGTPPSKNQVMAGFAPQMTLEAAMALRGAFGLDAKPQSAEALYLKLGGPTGGKMIELDFADAKGNGTGKSFMDIAEEHYRGLIDLLSQFRSFETPYPSRPFPKFALRYNVYDHLARVKEWAQEDSGETL